jgi:murein DD-endopeptidase MepM/ murein hydrolase activator NlpD
MPYFWRGDQDILLMIKKEKYFYNPHTLQYEKVRQSAGQVMMKVAGFLATSFFLAFIIAVLAFTFIDSPKLKRAERELEQMELNYELLQDRMARVDKVLGEIEERDDNLYRAVFEAEPISSDVRNMGYGGTERLSELNKLTKGELLKDTYKKMHQLERKLYVQSKSFDEIAELIENKEDMLSSIPAIAPVKNTTTWIASGFGYRIDPIYKTRKFHQGMDFSGSTGLAIYATGDAKVERVRRSRRGYGNQITLDHGYGYKTSYSHLQKIHVSRGQEVKRGEMIATMGSTGKSTAPHLHYEVIKDGRKVNPIYFFYNDLSPEEYDELIKLVDSNKQSFD